MMRRSAGPAALAAVLLTATLAGAQPPAGGAQGAPQAAPPPPANLHVLPKDIARPQLLQTMQAFAAALGVECSHCHVREGAGGRNDMASDEKQPKKTARAMMLLVADINAKIPAAAAKTADAAVKVECMTCHRGVAIPKALGDILTETTAASGMPAAVAKYRELRTKYNGAMAYDFSDAGLIALANRIAMAKPDDALQWLELNVEFNPKSARSHLAMAQILNRKGDKAAAITHAEAALAIEPDNAMAKMLLENLKK